MKLIYGAVVFFALLALLAGWQAFTLIPADLGASYLVVASTLLSAAGLMACLPLVAREIARELRHAASALAPAGPASVPDGAAHPDVVDMPLPPVLTGMGAAMLAPEAMKPAIEPKAQPSPEADLREVSVEPPRLAKLEHDIRAERADPVAEPRSSLSPDAMPEPATPMGPETVSGNDIDDFVLAPMPPAPDLLWLEPGEAEPARPAQGGPREARAVEPDEPDHIAAPVAPEPLPATMPERAPEPVPQPAPVSSVAGLIHDEDLARIEEAEPMLAPLETLEMVGSYDSGGTRFTMYSDGSVMARGEGVDRRFRSLDELRAFIDTGMRD